VVVGLIEQGADDAVIDVVVGRRRLAGTGGRRTMVRGVLVGGGVAGQGVDDGLVRAGGRGGGRGRGGRGGVLLDGGALLVGHEAVDEFVGLGRGGGVFALTEERGGGAALLGAGGGGVFGAGSFDDAEEEFLELLAGGGDLADGLEPAGAAADDLVDLGEGGVVECVGLDGGAFGEARSSSQVPSPRTLPP
jgi:hypothetical protein